MDENTGRWFKMSNKWEKLKELYKWKIETIKSNPEPTTWDKYDKEHYEHVLTEMKRIEKNFQ